MGYRSSMRPLRVIIVSGYLSLRQAGPTTTRKQPSPLPSSDLLMVVLALLGLLLQFCAWRYPVTPAVTQPAPPPALVRAAPPRNAR